MLQVTLLKTENNFRIKLKTNYCEQYSQMCKMSQRYPTVKFLELRYVLGYKFICKAFFTRVCMYVMACVCILYSDNISQFQNDLRRKKKEQNKSTLCCIVSSFSIHYIFPELRSVYFNSFFFCTLNKNILLVNHVPFTFSRCIVDKE